MKPTLRFRHGPVWRVCLSTAITLLLLTSACGKSNADKAYDSVPDEFPYGKTAVSASDSHSREDPDDIALSASANDNESDNPAESKSLKRLRLRNIGRLAEVFNDSNHRHLSYAESLGISPIVSVRDAYRTRRPVIRIVSNEFYEVDSLIHSLPYLVPESAALLEEIGRNFTDSLKSRGAGGYRIKVTSLLRTPATVRSLRRVNINATETSTHQYGTTFDLSYTHFHNFGNSPEIHDGDLKNLLAEVLLDLRDRKRCLVKFERKSACFHVTAIR